MSVPMIKVGPARLQLLYAYGRRSDSAILVSAQVCSQSTAYGSAESRTVYGRAGRPSPYKVYVLVSTGALLYELTGDGLAIGEKSRGFQHRSEG